MATIQQLPLAGSINGGDTFVIWATNQGDSRKVSATVLVEYVQSNLTDAVCDTLTAREYAKVNPVTVANLPSASAAIKGARAFVSDSNAALAAGIGNAVATGGSNAVPVYCDGVTWRIG
jgi:hypothetical protein